MARPRKVPPGSVTRSVLLRAEQAAALEGAAATIGGEVSDLIRAAVDVLFPREEEPRYPTRTRVRAALELRRREIAHRSDLVEAALAGWVGGRSEVLELRAGRVAAGVVRDVVTMLLALHPSQEAKAVSSKRTLAKDIWSDLARDWAAEAALPLLEVIASPAVWAFRIAPERGPGERQREQRPDFVFAARSVAAGATGGPTGASPAEPAENQYRRAAAGVAEMARHGVLEPTPPDWPWAVFNPFPVVAYAVHWGLTAAVRSRG